MNIKYKYDKKMGINSFQVLRTTKTLNTMKINI